MTNVYVVMQSGTGPWCATAPKIAGVFAESGWANLIVSIMAKNGDGEYSVYPFRIDEFLVGSANGGGVNNSDNS